MKDVAVLDRRPERGLLRFGLSDQVDDLSDQMHDLSKSCLEKVLEVMPTSNPLSQAQPGAY